MAYTLFLASCVHHFSGWNTPPDLWGTFRDAHYVIWDGEGQVYNANTNFVTFPGIAVLLAPFAEIQQALHLSESFPVYLFKPTAWYVLGPVDLLGGGILLFPLDVIARRLSLSYIGAGRSRSLFEVIAYFSRGRVLGSPGRYVGPGAWLSTLYSGLDRKWLHSAGFFSLAVVFSRSFFVLPIALAYVPFKKWPTFAVVTAVPTAALLIPPLLQEWNPTIYAIIKQPNFPTIDHATPWLSSPRF